MAISKTMTVGELKRLIADDDDSLPVKMCMDWTELENPPKRLQEQWNDGLGGIARTDEKIILLNCHFR